MSIIEWISSFVIFIHYNEKIVLQYASMAKPVFKTQFGSGIIEELKKVTWPTKEETLRLTVIVIGISLIIGVYIGIIDVLLTKGLELLAKSR